MLSDMIDFFNTENLLPHAICLSWRPDLLWLHAVSDLVTGLAYYSIPVALVVFAAKRKDLQFRWVFGLFGLFIIACGTTHLVGVYTLWHPAWELSGAIKAITAMASLATAALLWPLLPKALALPGPREWMMVNQDLREEISERRQVEAEVQRLNAELEDRVRDRTAELELANRNLEESNRALRAEIAARKAAESELLKAKQDAEKANLAKSRFLAAASHDLRQPVQSLFYFFAVLENMDTGRKTEEVIEGMQQSLEGLKLLLDALLDTSKLDAGIVATTIETVQLGDILARLSTEYAPIAQTRDLDLRIMPTRLAVKSDHILLERIIRNLIENALRYTDSGRILVGCRARPGHGQVRVMVIDTGPGIPQDQHDAIFDEFIQLGNPERDRSKGLGLGLAIVRRAARLLDHDIGLHSEPGRGSCFFVDLPKAELGRESGGPIDFAASFSPSALSQGTICIIEDEALVRRGLAAMLGAWGYRVVEAESGSLAVAELDRLKIMPDLVIADYRLRDGERGRQAIEQVQDFCGGQRLPALIITGDTAPDRLREARASGYELLHKPVTATDLRQTIEGMMKIPS